ncbi:hypothetical protein BB559_004610 [Furculomyces boomerangus]|uniref:Potassium channel tetramerisation-type BTB domain-containing protein n=2 Tax=Harpellales TaxID=61421 RepID=A0A2T9YDV4_9FUNG|nr:hypothetical protein BB559_004610 [Furculomyces boomerangus]PVZ98455.1 hypothetical protein BB558_005536 [Smittium angustum]
MSLKFVTLNIGGIRYETSLKTLLTKPNTLLCTFFSDSKAYTPPDSNGEYFFDRDGNIFSGIINWYRSSNRDISEFFTEKQFNESIVRQELEFFRIPHGEVLVNLANSITSKSEQILLNFTQTILKLCIIATESCMSDFALYPPKPQGDFHCWGRYEWDLVSVEKSSFVAVSAIGGGGFLPPARPGNPYKFPMPSIITRDLLPARRFENTSWSNKCAEILKSKLPNIQIINDDYMWIICGFSDQGGLPETINKLDGLKIATYPYTQSPEPKEIRRQK